MHFNIFNIFCRQKSKGSWQIGYSWFLFLLCSFSGGLGLVHNRKVLQGTSWVGQDFHTYPHPGRIPVAARDVMVNVVNSLGLKLLAIHNENNDDNIAISPYGALSILIALGEGLQGEAVRELQKAAHIPNDISLIRIGLRDIHRHLKSYFIPPEGFLAGLTLNHENVTLKPKYEDVLQFYGYDIMSFNNALYPSPPTTQYPIASTTDEITTKPMEPTTLQQTTTESLTSSARESTTLTPISTTTVLPLTIPTTVTTELPMNDISAGVPETTTTASTTNQDILPTTETLVLITESLSTTESNMDNTEEIQSTTSEESILTELPTTILSTTTETTTSTPFTSEDIVSTTTMTAKEITTEVPTTTDIVTTEITTNIPTTEAIATTNSMETTEISAPETDTVESTTTESTVTEVITVELTPTEPGVTEAVTTEEAVQSIETTLSEISTTQTESSETTTFEATASEAVATEAVTSDSTTTEEALPESTSTDSELETTTSLLTFPYPDASTPEAEVITEDTENIVKRKTRSKVELIKLNSPIERIDVAKPLSLSSSRNRRRRSKRKARSVVDYMIARYYDDYQYHPLYNNQGVPYVPQTKPSFLIQGKYREHQVQFMKYDTMLPFFYVSYLNALALSFPLDSPQYYLLLLLPVQEDGVDQLICELRLNGSFKYIIDNLRYRHVTAVIPSFLLKGYVNLTPTFQKLGIRRVFEPRQADFSPMTNLKDVYITNIEQAITVNIKNYMDPAAAFGESRQFHQEAPIEFRADHPFVYFVVDAEFHVVLMTGKIVNPLNTRIT